MVDRDELDRVYSKYKKAVNMSYSELKRWSKTDCSKKASNSRAPIKRNLKLLNKNKSDWTSKDIEDAKRTISFISRMKAVKAGEPVCNGKSKRTISLMNWAYNPNR